MGIKFLDPERHSFHFKPHDKKALLQVLGGKQELIAQLEFGVSVYRTLAAAESDQGFTLEDQRKNIQAIRRATARLEAVLSDLGASWRLRVVRDAEVSTLPRELKELRSWCDRKLTMRFKRGPKPSGALATLDGVVAATLQEVGVRLTRGRDGRFAKCLERVREAAGIPTQADMFESIRRACDQIKRESEAKAWIEANTPRRPVE